MPRGQTQFSPRDKNTHSFILANAAKNGYKFKSEKQKTVSREFEQFNYRNFKFRNILLFLAEIEKTNLDPNAYVIIKNYEIKEISDSLPGLPITQQCA